MNDTLYFESLFPVPAGERARAKQIPIALLDTVRAAYRAAGVPVRIRFRGPRGDTMRLTTLKRHARAFTVYTV
jgi:hypothetical protein